MLQTEDFKPRNLIKKANVKVICTTDDLNSDLTYHKLLADDEKDFRVLPSMRPDGLFKIYQESYPAYVETLSALTSVDVHDTDSLKRPWINASPFLITLVGMFPTLDWILTAIVMYPAVKWTDLSKRD